MEVGRPPSHTSKTLSRHHTLSPPKQVRKSRKKPQREDQVLAFLSSHSTHQASPNRENQNLHTATNRNTRTEQHRGGTPLTRDLITF